MKKLIYALILPLVVISGFVFANRERGNKISESSNLKHPAPATALTPRQEWEASPDGLKYKAWEASPAGRKVLAGAARIMAHTSAFTNMEAEVTSLTLPPGSRLGLGIMARINGEEYIISFGPLNLDEYQELKSLKVSDRIIIKSRGVSWAPKYAYPIVSGDYIERGSKVIYKRVPNKGGC